MERVTKSKSDRSRSFKQRGIDVNKRSLRIHRRSLDWRANRQDDVNRRRNLSGMSPLQEVTINTEINFQEKIEKKEETKPMGTPKLSRADKLKKWRAEKELKKQLEKIENSKKKVFKVMHVKQEEYEKVTDNLVKPKLTANVKSQPQEKTKPKSKVAAPPVRRSARLAGTQPKKEQKTITAKKSTKPTATASKNVKPQKEKKEPEPQAKQEQKQKDFITHMRGNRLMNEQESFAPNDFSFNAPANVMPFPFKPLSPQSASKFLMDPKGLSALQTPPTRGRCSTPLRAFAKGSKIVHSPPRTAEKLDTVVNEKDKEPTEVPEAIQNTVSKESMEVPEAIQDLNQEPDFPGQLDQIPEETPMEVEKASDEQEGQFLSPNYLGESGRSSRKRAKSANSALSGRKTPKALRNSLILQTLSPEESVEILAKSPMIEMKRRTPKGSATKGHIPIEPILNFDEAIEEEERNLQKAAASEVQDKETIENKPDLEKTDNDGQAVENMNSDKNTSEKNGMAVSLQETSTENKEPVHDVPYFRNLVTSETNKLNTLSDKWDLVNEENDLSEEAKGQIRTTIGQAKLLIAQRFKQFLGLVDNCEHNSGEKEIGYSDLQGFWDMVYFQVEDVHVKFDNLAKLQANNWISDEPKKKVVKRVVKKKNAAAAVKGKAKPSGKSSFAAFRAKMKQQQQEEKDKLAVVPSGDEGTKTFEGGFFAVSSPCQSPRAHNNCKAATPNGNSSCKKESTSTRNLAPMSSPFLSVVPSHGLAAKSVLSPATQNKQEENGQTELKNSSSCTPQIIVREADQETPRRRSSRKRPGLSADIFSPEKSAKKQERQPESIITEEDQMPSNENEQPMETGDNPFDMYLKPVQAQNVENTPGKSLLDSSDIFSEGPSPAVKVFGATYSGRKSHKQSPFGARRLSSSEKRDCRTASGRTRNRRSVRFTPNAKNQKDSSMHIPGTPFNKDSLEPISRSNPGRRTSKRLSNIANIQDSLFSPASDSPASRMAKMSVNSNTPAESSIKPRRVSELLYTPPAGRRSPRFSPITSKSSGSDLMSFSPL